MPPTCCPGRAAGTGSATTASWTNMFLDGLEDAYDRGRPVGTFAEDAAQSYQFSRAEQNAYAISA